MGHLTKTGDSIEFNVKAMQKKYDQFIANIPEGAKVEMFVSISTEKGSNAQLARVHAMIRELANTIGYTFEEVKLHAKRSAGLCYRKNNDEYCKSFADCDKVELNLVIQALVEMGDFNDTNLR